MPYKNKGQQRDAIKRAVAKHRKGITPGITYMDIDTVTAAKLLMICKACDKEVKGLDGEVNLLSLIRYGIGGHTLESIKGKLE